MKSQKESQIILHPSSEASTQSTIHSTQVKNLKRQQNEMQLQALHNNNDQSQQNLLKSISSEQYLHVRYSEPNQNNIQIIEDISFYKKFFLYLIILIMILMSVNKYSQINQQHIKRTLSILTNRSNELTELFDKISNITVTSLIKAEINNVKDIKLANIQYHNHLDAHAIMQEYIHAIDTNYQEVSSLIENVYQETSAVYDLPKIIWLYTRQGDALLHSDINITKNIEKYSKKNNFTIYKLTNKNVGNYLNFDKNVESQQSLVEFERIIKYLRMNQHEHNLKQYYSQILIPHLICLYILRQHGGIWLDEAVLLTEDYANWMISIGRNKYLEEGLRFINEPHLLTFHSLIQSTKESLNVLDQTVLFHYQDELQQNIYSPFHIIVPFIVPDILAAKNTLQAKKFITKVISAFQQNIKIPFSQKILQYQPNINSTHLHAELTKYFEELLPQTIQKLILQQQKYYNKLYFHGFRKYSFVQNSILTLESDYFVNKIHLLFSNQPDTLLYYLKKIDIDQFQTYFGKIRFAIKLKSSIFNQKVIKEFQLKYGKKNKNRSFWNIYLLGKEPIETSNELEQKVDKKIETSSWNDLPKIIWMIKPLHHNPLQDFCLHNIKNMNHENNFKIYLISKNQLQNIISPQSFQRFQNIIKAMDDKQIYVNPEQVFKLFLLKEKGGVWISSHIFATESFDWLLNIFTNKYLLNNISKKIQVLNYFHTNQVEIPWNISQKLNLRYKLNVEYQNDFLAANPETDLFKDWIAEIQKNSRLSIQELLEYFSSFCLIKDLTFSNIHELFIDASLACILKQKQLKTKDFVQNNPLSYPQASYGLWSLNSKTGFNKLTSQISEINENLKFNLCKYSEQMTEEVLGQFRYLVKIAEEDIQALNHILKSNKKLSFDPNSLFKNYLKNT